MEKDLRKAAHPSYFSIDFILASDTRLSCRTERNIPKFGFLASEFSLSNTLVPGISLKLPIWMAKAVWRRNREDNYISVDIPRYYKNGVWDIMEVDQCLTNVTKFHPQFFESGLQVLSTFLDKTINVEDDLPEQLCASLKERLLCIGDGILPKVNPNSRAKRYATFSVRSSSKSGPSRHFLDRLEQKIYDESLNRTLEMQEMTRGMTREDFSVQLSAVKQEIDS